MKELFSDILEGWKWIPYYEKNPIRRIYIMIGFLKVRKFFRNEKKDQK